MRSMPPDRRSPNYPEFLKSAELIAATAVLEMATDPQAAKTRLPMPIVRLSRSATNGGKSSSDVGRANVLGASGT